MTAVGTLEELFAASATAAYLGEAVTQAQHMFQAAALAEADEAPAALVLAALLHDVGHVTGAIGGDALMAGTDNHHSGAGADWLARWFGPEVTEPVRLHVAAKRYLCAVEPDYLARLSPASVHTLEVQGGIFTTTEAARFAARAYALDAVRVRRYDDEAKDPDAQVPGFEHYAPLIAALDRSG